MTIAAVIAAGGTGSRFKGELPKQYHLLKGKAILQHTLDVFMTHPKITNTLVVIGADDHQYYEKFIEKNSRLLPPVVGGSTRQASILNGLQALIPLNPDLVLVHDAVRPFVSWELIDRVLAPLSFLSKGCVPVLPITETIKRITPSQSIEATLPRDHLCLAQTPQGFQYPLLLKAHEKFQDHLGFTDDACLFEELGLGVTVCAGDNLNIKITYPEDLKNAQSHR